MYFSRRVDYAVRGMQHVAAARRQVFVKEIAEREDIPQSSLAKIFQALARHGLVSSARGRAGGFLLGLPIEHITLARIIEAVEGPLLPPRCPFADEACGRKDQCFVYGVWQDAARQMLRALEAVTLRDLMNAEAARQNLLKATPPRSDSVQEVKTKGVNHYD